MKTASARVEVVNLHEKNVCHCTGCNVCWVKKPGMCAIEDDMTVDILPKFQEADLAVIAAPMYHWTINGKMKAVMGTTDKADLTIEAPLALWLEIQNGAKDLAEMVATKKCRMTGDTALIEQLRQPFS
jgi:FMN-dependent NADH-azoreductase